MASDGCQPLVLSKSAAPKSESYRDLRVPPTGHDAPQKDAWGQKQRPAATGTWDGPAPVENVGVRVASQVAQERPFDPRSEPRTLMLNNKMKLPLIGAHVTDGETATLAITSSLRWLDIPHGADYEGIGKAIREKPDGVSRGGLFLTATLPPALAAGDVASTAASIEAALGHGPLDLLLLDCAGDAEDAEKTADSWQALLNVHASDTPGAPLGLGVANAGVGVLDWLLLGAGALGVQPAINRVPELNPMAARRKMCGTCRRKGGVAPVAMAPLGAKGDAQEVLRGHAAVAAVAEATGRPVDAVLVRYALQRGTPVLLSREDLDAVAAAGEAFEFRLDYSQKVLLDTLPQGAPPGLLSALFGECSAALAGRSVIFLAPACLPSRDN